jgi:hypothetical protein
MTCGEDVTAPPELLTLAVGADPTLEVGPLPEIVVADVGTALVPCVCDEVFCGVAEVAFDGAGVPVLGVAIEVPLAVADVDVVLDVDEAVDELAEAEEEVVPVSALAGPARALPARAARPNAARAAVAAMRFLII